jgi:vitamin B12/bleomycin/antimicrobial peptide transport system ATP-binding/permease protein
MMWVAVLYAGLGSWLTYKIGRPLVRVNFELQRYNADFRYRMIRVRESAESIALYNGELDEVRRLAGAFQRIYGMWWNYMRYNKRLTWFTAFYGQAADVFPLVVASPRYFAGIIPFGVLTQTANAFGRVQGALSWFVDTFASLADWKATTDRLTTFSETIAATKRAQKAERMFHVRTTDGNVLSFRDVEVDLPDGAALLRNVDLTIERGSTIAVQGPSGSGKTTLFRVIAGIWPFGRGDITLPRNARMLFLPQRPYLPLGALREVLSYPDKPDTHDDRALVDALIACRLPHLTGRLDESANWALALSPGEQQRVAFARALLYRPDWLFLDEASTALDEPTEADLYRMLEQRLPGTTLISIAHDTRVVAFHDARIIIDPRRGRATLAEVRAAE